MTVIRPAAYALSLASNGTNQYYGFHLVWGENKLSWY